MKNIKQSAARRRTRMKKILYFFFALITSLIIATPIGAAPTEYDLVESGLSTVRHIYQQSPSFCHPGPGFDETRLDECVSNPFTAEGCVWSVDDTWTASAVGRKIGAGVLASAEQCFLADNRIPWWGVRVQADKPGLVVEIHFEPQNHTFTLAPQQFGSRWEWRGCMYGPTYAAATSVLPEIEGSNGGNALKGTVKVSVENPTGKFIANPSTIFLLRPGFRTGYCQGERDSISIQNALYWLEGLKVKTQ